MDVSYKKPKRQIRAADRFGEYVADIDFKRKIKPQKPGKKTKEHGWYRVNSISGHRVVKVKNHDQIELKIYWEGYTDPSWENFCGFVKDTSVKVERYLIRN